MIINDGMKGTAYRCGAMVDFQGYGCFGHLILGILKVSLVR
jgi:hypothetical protein